MLSAYRVHINKPSNFLLWFLVSVEAEFAIDLITDTSSLKPPLRGIISVNSEIQFFRNVVFLDCGVTSNKGERRLTVADNK